MRTSQEPVMHRSRPSAALALVHHGGHGAAPIVLGLPAMGTPARYYDPFARALAEASGATVAFADLRGQGDSPVRARKGADFGYREIVEEDLPALVDAFCACHPRRPLVLLGHSLGGQLCTLAAHRFAGRLAGLVLVASGTAHFRAWPRSQRLAARLAVAGIGLAATLLPWYPGHLLGFGGEQPRRLMRDWMHNANTGHYALGGRWSTACLRVPVLSLSVRHDPIAPRGAAEELLAMLESADVTRIVMDGVLDDSRWRRHFSWARRPAEAAALVANWLRELEPHSCAEPTLPAGAAEGAARVPA